MHQITQPTNTINICHHNTALTLFLCLSIFFLQIVFHQCINTLFVILFNTHTKLHNQYIKSQKNIAQFSYNTFKTLYERNKNVDHKL